MNLDESIDHCMEVIATSSNEKCRDEHNDLLGFLIELKELRAKFKQLAFPED